MLHASDRLSLSWIVAEPECRKYFRHTVTDCWDNWHNLLLVILKWFGGRWLKLEVIFFPPHFSCSCDWMLWPWYRYLDDRGEVSPRHLGTYMCYIIHPTLSWWYGSNGCNTRSDIAVWELLWWECGSFLLIDEVHVDGSI